MKEKLFATFVENFRLNKCGFGFGVEDLIRIFIFRGKEGGF
jgi:hypothetical protein